MRKHIRRLDRKAEKFVPFRDRAFECNMANSVYCHMSLVLPSTHSVTLKKIHAHLSTHYCASFFLGKMEWKRQFLRVNLTLAVRQP